MMWTAWVGMITSCHCLHLPVILVFVMCLVIQFDCYLLNKIISLSHLQFTVQKRWVEWGNSLKSELQKPGILYIISLPSSSSLCLSLYLADLWHISNNSVLPWFCLCLLLCGIGSYFSALDLIQQSCPLQAVLILIIIVLIAFNNNTIIIVIFW